MTVPVPKATKPPKIQTQDLNNWLGGTVTAFDDGRTPADGLRSSSNVILEQDGTVRPRPSLQLWGPQPTGVVKGEIYEFRSVDGLDTTNRLISMQEVDRSEVQTLAISGTPTGGSFTLTYAGQTTGSIAYNASASDVQTALLALSNLDTGDVVCTEGSLPGTAVVITFGGTLADTDVAAITSTSSLTGGTSPTITITETTKGGTYCHIHIALPEDDTWTVCNDADGNPVDYDKDARAHFFQINDKVVILNGEDSLSFLDISTVDSTPQVTVFTALSDATAPTIANNGSTDITTGTTPYTVWYAVTANSTVGETGGVYTSKAINLQRSLWDKDKNSLKITWSAVTDAQSYNLYAAVGADGDSNPNLNLLASGLDANTLSFVDDGTLGLATFKPMPAGDNANSTAGPKATRGVAINGRAWLTGDKNNPYYLWHGGDPGHELDFTPTYGGGFVMVGNGTGEIPNRVWNFRSGPGDPQIKCLTRGLNGTGKRYTISSSTLTYASSSFTVWAPTEDYGYSGTDSPDGLIVYKNNTYYPSRDGFKTIGTKPQLQNLLDTDEVSQTIQGDLGLLNNDAMGLCVGMGFEGRLYWSVPVGYDSNNQIWVLDLDRKGAWMKPWSVAAEWMLLVADNDGYTHHVILSDNKLYEFSYATRTSDDGTAFSTSGSTGLNYFSKDGREWARLIKVVIEVLRPIGTINFSVSGYTKDGIVPLGNGTITEATQTSGYGWAEGGWETFGWDDFSEVPNITSAASKDVPIKINKDVRFWSVTWSTTGPNIDYSISKIIPEFVSVGIKNLS